MSKISYSAIVLNDESHTKLLLLLENLFPEQYANPDFVKIAHHMTICMGPLVFDELREYIGSTTALKAVTVGYDDKVIAVGVTGGVSTNKYPHVTLAVNYKVGGKPVMSNNLTNWTKLESPITLIGTVKELEQ